MVFWHFLSVIISQKLCKNTKYNKGIIRNSCDVIIHCTNE